MRRLVILSMLLVAPSLSGCVVATSSRSTGSAGSGLFVLFLPFILMMLMFRMLRAGTRRTRSRRVVRERRPEPVSAAGPDVGMIRAELSVLADDVLRLEPQVAIHESARDDYEAAAHRYRVAQSALEQHGGRVDLVRLQRVVDEANWAMARVRADLQGRRPPAPPSSLRQPGPRGEPAIQLDERQQPVYVGSREPFRAGWFAGGGLLGGLLLGPMLGGWIVHSSDGDDGWDDPHR